MAKSIKQFTFEEFLATQIQILQAFEKKLNQLFIESAASKKKDPRYITLETLSLLRETIGWYIRINTAMLKKNSLPIKKEDLTN